MVALFSPLQQKTYMASCTGQWGTEGSVRECSPSAEGALTPSTITKRRHQSDCFRLLSSSWQRWVVPGPPVGAEPVLAEKPRWVLCSGSGLPDALMRDWYRVAFPAGDSQALFSPDK